MSESDDIVDFQKAKGKVVQARKEAREQALKARFKKAMGIKASKPAKRKPTNKGPKPKRPPKR